MAMIINAGLLVAGGVVSWLTIRNDVLQADADAPLDGGIAAG
jgi:hypothetical protein